MNLQKKFRVMSTGPTSPSTAQGFPFTVTRQPIEQQPVRKMTLRRGIGTLAVNDIDSGQNDKHPRIFGSGKSMGFCHFSLWFRR